MDATSKALFKGLDLVRGMDKGEVSPVADFAAELLRAMGYETRAYVGAHEEDLPPFHVRKGC